MARAIHHIATSQDVGGPGVTEPTPHILVVDDHRDIRDPLAK